MLGLLRPRRLVLLALVAAGIFGWVQWKRAHHTTTVDESSAVRSFREGSTGAGGAGAPRPGVYTYRQSGRERGGIGPLGIERDLPREARMIIRTRRDGYESELDLAKEHVEASRYRRSPGGLRTTWIRTKLSFGGFGRDDRRTTSPQPVFMPPALRVGQVWAARYTTGDLPVAETSRVTGRDTVRIAGVAVPVFVIRTRSVTGGSHPGDQEQTTWWSPRHELPMRLSLRRRIRGTVRLDVTAELVLTSLAPRT